MTTIIESITTYVLYALAFPTVFWLVAYLIPQVYMSTIRAVPNLKDRYPGASWALVTGSGSGIGRALCFKLASQGLNVVLVSLDDDHLENTLSSLREKYPALEFRSVGCDFVPGSDYLAKIRDATSDIDVRCVFNNAGFIVTGFVDQSPLSKLLSNVECNATASFAIAHHYLERMVSRNLTGCVVFTSSVAGFVPTPFAASYAATKAFVSQLACSLHIEVGGLGIDVCAVHPSPVSSNFYDKVSGGVGRRDNKYEGDDVYNIIHVYMLSLSTTGWRWWGLRWFQIAPPSRRHSSFVIYLLTTNAKTSQHHDTC